MKKKLLAIVICFISLLGTGVYGCGSNGPDNRIHMPSSSNDYKKVNYQYVVDDLVKAGFTNVATKPVQDLITGIITKDGTVESVDVGGYTTFSKDSKYAPDTKIVVAYHTFKGGSASDNPVVSASPSVSPSESLKPSVSPSPSTSVGLGYSSSPSVNYPSITIENNKEFEAILLTKDPESQIVKDFVKKYITQTIEFDGNIGAINYSNKYKTKYDILVLAGDYNETTSNGPYFTFTDIAPSDLGNKDLYLPSYVKTGSNIHVVAKINNYEELTGHFELKPLLITER